MSTLNIPVERWQESKSVGGRVELHDVRLHTLNSSLKQFDTRPPYVADLEVEASVQREDGDLFFAVSAEYSLKAMAYGAAQDQNGDIDPDVVAAEVTFTLLALYSLSELREGQDESTDDEFEAFAESTGLMTLHPYARELIQDQTARLGLPPLTVGVATIEQ